MFFSFPTSLELFVTLSLMKGILLDAILFGQKAEALSVSVSLCVSRWRILLISPVVLGDENVFVVTCLACRVCVAGESI